MNGTDHAISFIMQTKWDDLPAEVQHQAKRALLDLLGALIAGTETPVAEMMTELAITQYAGGEATILGNGPQASAVGATLANGFAANALDIDDGYRGIKGHPGACVLPALLAAAECVEGVSGIDFLTALIIGYEVGIRAGLIRHATYEVYHSSGSWGAIAAAAAVGKLFGLDAPTLRHAMGVAEYHAPIAPMMKGVDVPNMGKDSIGWGTMVGMSSVLMAQQGFTGIEPLFSDASPPAGIPDFGVGYEVMNIYFKPYACCRWAQPAIDGAIEIAQTYQLAPKEIDRIRVRTFVAATRLVCSHPRTTEEAQYNLAYPVAAALIDGKLGPRQILPPRLFDPTLLALSDRVETEIAPEYEAVFPAKTCADIIVHTQDGRTLSATGKQANWEPPHTLPTDDELNRKFHWLVTPILGDAQSKAIAKLVWGLEDVDDVMQLIELCVA